MSGHGQGAGWWKASDGNWYPPESHPDSHAGLQYESPSRARSPGASRKPAEWVAIAGAGAVVIGSFLPWASIGAYSVRGTDNGDGLWTLVAGCIAGGLVIGRLLVGALMPFVIATLLGGYELLNVSAVESDASFWSVKPGVGLFAIIGGGIAGVIGVCIAQWGAD